MQPAAVLRAGRYQLRRADAGDRDRLLALQRGAYARNRPLLGVEPLPLLADYAAILRDMEGWLAEDGDRLLGALILEPRSEDLLIWSIAVDPVAQGEKLGGALLAAADARARTLGVRVVRLYTGTPLRHLIAWYQRNGYAIERVEDLSDRSITHMIKPIAAPASSGAT